MSAPPDRGPLLRQLYGTDEENALPTALCLLLVTETLGRATGRADPLLRQHLRQLVRAELWYGVLGLGTCGLGFFLWYPSFARWRFRARAAAAAGEPVEPW